MADKAKFALGKFKKAGEKDGKKFKATLSIQVDSPSKEQEKYVRQQIKSMGFKDGDGWKSDKGVKIPGTIWLEEEFPEGVANALDGKLAFYENGIIKKATNVSYKTYNAKKEKGSTIVAIAEPIGDSKTPMVRYTGNLVAYENDKKEKKYMLTNKVVMETNEGEAWKPETVEKHIAELKALGLNAQEDTYEGKKYLNITKNIGVGQSSVLYDNEKLFKAIKEARPFVVMETDIYSVMNGSHNLLVDKNNRITPLGEKSSKVFEKVMDKLTVIPKNEKEDLYADSEQAQTQEEDNGPVAY